MSSVRCSRPFAAPPLHTALMHTHGLAGDEWCRLSSRYKNCKRPSTTLYDFSVTQIHVFFSPPTSKTCVSSKSQTGSGAHKVPHVVCSSHLVIPLLKHLIRGRNALPLSVSRCARSSLGSLAADEKKRLSTLSVSTRPSPTQGPCSFPQRRTPPTQISLSGLAGPPLSLSVQTHAALSLFFPPSFRRLSSPASVIV